MKKITLLISLFYYLTVSAQVANQPNDMELCDVDNDGFSQFDLSIVVLEVIDSQDSMFITFFVSQVDADSGEFPIVNSTNFTNTSNPQPIYVRLEDSTTGNFDTTTFNLIVNPSPIPNQPTPLELCDDDTADGFAVFDLTIKDTEITGGNPTWPVTYYETSADAMSQINPILDPTQYSNISNAQTIFVVVTDVNTGCLGFTTLQLIVNPLPVLVQPQPLALCDVNNPGDEQEAFTLEDAIAEILNGQIGITLSHYETQMDADNATNPIVSPYTNTTNAQTIYVRAESDITGCYSSTILTLVVNPLPFFNISDSVVRCIGESVSVETGLSASIYSFEWSFNAATIPNETDSSFIATQSGTYSVVVTDAISGCSTVDTFEVIEVICTDTDNDGVIDSDEDLNSNGNLEDDDTDDDGTPNYLDNDDDGDNVDTIIEINIVLGRNTIHPFVDTDNDTIENYLDDDDDGDNVLTIDEDYNNNGDPTDDDTNTNNIPDYLESAVALSLNEFTSMNFSMYPNPAKGEVTIQLASSNLGTGNLNIYNTQGKAILTDISFENNASTIDISTLESGFYFVELTIGNSSTVQKLIVD